MCMIYCHLQTAVFLAQKIQAAHSKTAKRTANKKAPNTDAVQQNDPALAAAQLVLRYVHIRHLSSDYPLARKESAKAAAATFGQAR